MKKKHLFIVAIIMLTVMVLVFNISESSKNWTVPDSLIGDWSGKQKASVRFIKIVKYSFASAKDSVDLTITIQRNASVSGNFGTAKIENCKINKNRGWIGKKFNLFSDYIITGKLKGAIFPADTIIVKEISFPFNVSSGSVSGTIFQKQGINDIYPMADVKLLKQKKD